MTKCLSDYQDKDFLDNGKVKITNDWFTDQVRSYINEEDFENFLHKSITVEDLTEDTVYVMESMLLKFSETKYYNYSKYITDSIQTIVALYNKFGKSMYGYEKKLLVSDIKTLVKDLESDKIEDIIQKLPSFYAFETAMHAHRMDNNNNELLLYVSVFSYMKIDQYFQFIIEDAEEGVKALKDNWRHFKLWKLYRRLEKQGKIPVYKDKEIEDNLWSAKSDPDYLLGDLDNIKTITPFDETIARNITYGFHHRSKTLLFFHVHGVFEALRRFYVPHNMNGNIPKRVLTELFKNGWHLDDYFSKRIDAITSSYDNKPDWWDIRFYRIPTVWNDWILVEWLFQKLKTSFKSMVKTRTYYMHGMKMQYNYFHKVDEIRPEDLVNGIKTSPSTAFKNSAIRLGKNRTEQNMKLPEASFKETDSVKQIKYSADFMEESKFMHNCVAGYVDSAINGYCFIYHVGINDKHGTMEVGKEGEVVQLYGPHNEDPDPSVLNAVEEWLKINNLKTSEVVKRWKNYMNNETFDEDEFY